MLVQLQIQLLLRNIPPINQSIGRRERTLFIILNLTILTTYPSLLIYKRAGSWSIFIQFRCHHLFITIKLCQHLAPPLVQLIVLVLNLVNLIHRSLVLPLLFNLLLSLPNTFKYLFSWYKCYALSSLLMISSVINISIKFCTRIVIILI